MPAPSASTPFLPNLNQHVALEPHDCPNWEVGLHHPSLLVIVREPLNGETNLGPKVEELMVLEHNVSCREHEIMEAIVLHLKHEAVPIISQTLLSLSLPYQQTSNMFYSLLILFVEIY